LTGRAEDIVRPMHLANGYAHAVRPNAAWSERPSFARRSQVIMITVLL